MSKGGINHETVHFEVKFSNNDWIVKTSFIDVSNPDALRAVVEENFVDG